LLKHSLESWKKKRLQDSVLATLPTEYVLGKSREEGRKQGQREENLEGDLIFFSVTVALHPSVMTPSSYTKALIGLPKFFK
jgi:hypothetical protein